MADTLGFRQRLRLFTQQLSEEFPASEMVSAAIIFVLEERINDATPGGSMVFLVFKGFGFPGAPPRRVDDAYQGVLADLDTFAKADPVRADVFAAIYLSFAERLDREGREREAATVLEHGLASLPKVKTFGRLLAKWKNLTAVGKPMKRAGRTVEGAEFDLDSLRGKVVLVDCWAT